VGIIVNAGIMALLSMAVSLAPMFAGIMYAIRPTEGRLALMRPLSLAGIFSALTGFSVGMVNALMGLSNAAAPLSNNRIWIVGTAESMISLFIGFGCLTVGWLCVALGMRRQAA
jgi:hypothetical protein